MPDINVISFDEENEPDVLAALGASFALSLSDIPFNGPIASVRVGKVDGNLIMNPTIEQMESSEFDLVLSGSSESIVMVEGKCDFVSVGRKFLLDPNWLQKNKNNYKFKIPNQYLRGLN